MGMPMQAEAARAASLRLKVLRGCSYAGDGCSAPLAGVGTPTRAAPLPSVYRPLRLDFPVSSNGCSSSQRRGLVVAADRTELLYQQGYWASYNLP